MAKAAYCVRADCGIYAEAFRKGGYAAIGWEVGDLSGIPQGEYEVFGAAYDSAYPDHGRSRHGMNVGQIGRFLWEIEPGDVVVTPTLCPDLLIGIMSPGYYYEATPNDDCPYPHRRKVDWIEEPVLRSSLSVPN